MKNLEDKFSNKNIAHILRSISAAYLLKAENRFKILAYEKAADVIEHLDRELKEIWREGQLNQVSGIGPSIGAHLDEYFSKGESGHFNEVLKDIPETVFIMMEIPTIGPKRAFKLVKELQLFNKNTLIEDLKKAGNTGKIAAIPTFGEKSEKEIMDAVKTYEQRKIKAERMPLPYAFAIADKIVNYLKKNPKIKRIDILGSLRRMTATIGDVDIAVVVEPKDTEGVLKYFVDYPNKIEVDNYGTKKASLLVYPYVRVDLRVQDKESYGSMLQYFTGSKRHNIQLREFALKKGYSLSEYGIKKVSHFAKASLDRQKSKLYKFKTENEFYNFLGLEYIPPEIREGTNEIEKAQKKQLPQLVELKDIRGDFHTHGDFDLKPSHDLGRDSYIKLAQKAKKLGYEYIGFSDHNPSLSSYSKEEIVTVMKKRKEHIDQLFMVNKFDHIKYFIGLEVDILSDGKLALPEKAIEYVDYLIVSIHSSFRNDNHQATERVLSALKFPKVKILGHPTGRMFGKREGYDLEWKKIFDACKNKNIALEINAWPERLDLPDTIAREAIQNGLKLCINSDAHAVDQMDNLFFGVEVARRGWCEKSDIINTLRYNEIREWIS